MRKIAAYIMIIVFLLTACIEQWERKQDTQGVESPTVSLSMDSVICSETEKEMKPSVIPQGEKDEKMPTILQNDCVIEPLLSEQIDTTKQGINMSTFLRFSTQATKGDDGFCYYFRNEGKGDKQKIVFYKNNGIKVCETTMKKSLKKKKYCIRSFVKYGNHFFVFLEAYWTHNAITTIDIETGEWGKIIKDPLLFAENIIIYDNRFYCLTNGHKITIYTLDGTKTEIKDFCPTTQKIRGFVQCIVDDKIYYVREKEVKEQEYISAIMRCNLDGSGKEKIFECRGKFRRWHPENLKIDGESMYFLFDYNKLFRIPLYGGTIKGTGQTIDWFELSDNDVFFYESGHEVTSHSISGRIYKIDKNFSRESKIVTEGYEVEDRGYWMTIIPFYYSDGHLLVKGYNKKERKVVDVVKNDEFGSWSSFAEITTNYADDYYWVTEDGEVEDTIKGSGVKERWKKKFKHLRPNSKINLDEL